MKLHLVALACALLAAVVFAQEPTTHKAEDTTTTAKAAETTTTKKEEPTTTKKEEPTTTKMVAPTTATPFTPAVNQWVVKDENGTVCLVMEASTFNISAKCDGNTVLIAVNVNETAQTGSCGSDYDVLEIAKASTYLVKLAFGTIGSSYELVNVTVGVDHTQFTSCKEFVPARVDGLTNALRAPKANVYRCNAEQSIVVNENATLILSQVKVQAFRAHGNSTTLSDTEYICMGDSNVSNIVPIAVGCALAGLIVIVLIAYIIGRVRRRPYEPV